MLDINEISSTEEFKKKFFSDDKMTLLLAKVVSATMFVLGVIMAITTHERMIRNSRKFIFLLCFMILEKSEFQTGSSISRISLQKKNMQKLKSILRLAMRF